MDNALPIGGIKRHAALEDDTDHPVHGQQTVDPRMVFEREALDVFHCQIGKVFFDNRFVNLDDIRMIQALGNHSLVLEQLAHAARHRTAILPELDHLDGNLAAGVWVIAKVDRRGRPLAQLSNDAIFADCFHSRYLRKTQGNIVARRHTGCRSFLCKEIW